MRTSVWAGVVAAAQTVGGRYCEDCHVAEIVEGRATAVAFYVYEILPNRADCSDRRVGHEYNCFNGDHSYATGRADCPPFDPQRRRA
jgi:hypothetical protein